MRKWSKIFFVCVAMIIVSMLELTTYAKTKPLDEIKSYDITVNMRHDGTMDIRYDIEWKVLDSKSEGPLEWVKIGCPNSHVDQITALTDNIKSVKYMSENGGSYIRVDFKSEYMAGEAVKFSYSIHQSYMYTLEEDNHLCRYSFTPGWFEEIEVDYISIRWNSDNVIESNAHETVDGYLVWKDSLDMGERLNTSVKYNLDVFDTNPDEQYQEGDKVDKIVVIIIVIIVVLIIAICVISFICEDDGYNGRSGFGGSRTTYIHTHSCARSSCACVSCACACACAGGGRAGCSLKDFYHTNLQTESLKKVLTKKSSTTTKF